MIPKNCFFIWTNHAPMSWLQALSVFSFHKYNSDWKIKIYVISQTPKELGAAYMPDYIGKDYFPTLSGFEHIEIDLAEFGGRKDLHGIQLSDLLRVKLLHLFGGVYSDFDMLWLKPMSEFPYKDFETTICQHPDGHHNNSNIVSEAKGKFLEKVITEQLNVKPPYDYQAFNTTLYNRLFPDFNRLKEEYPRLVKIPYSLFYPYSTYNMAQLFEQTDLTPLNGDVMGIHWFNGNEISKRYVTRAIPCSMTTILKKEGYL